MRDYLAIGPAPCDENCAAVGEDGFTAQNRDECRRFIELIRRECGPEAGSAELRVRSFSHDFGAYREVVCYYEVGDELGASYAFHCEGDSPTSWHGDGAKRFDDSLRISTLRGDDI